VAALIFYAAVIITASECIKLGLITGAISNMNKTGKSKRPARSGIVA